MVEIGQAAKSYAQLALLRATYLTRARAGAILTIPTLMPPEGHNATTNYPTPYQSVGARGLNNLASKLLLSLLPDSPFFRMQLDDFALAELANGEPDQRAAVEKAFNRIERAVMTEVDTIGLRAPVFEVLKQLINAGNVSLFLPKSGRPRVYRLDSYVAQRDPYGNLMHWIGCEEVATAVLSEAERALVVADTDDAPTAGMIPTTKVYTVYYRDGDRYRMHQEIGERLVQGSQGDWELDNGPLLCLRWTTVDGEDYGRSYVEEYLGDLQSLEGLVKAITEGAAASARLLVLVAPNGTTRKKDIEAAPNGAVVTGNAAEVTFLQTQKSADLQVGERVAQTITDRLSYAFLMSSAVQRQAERVTAEEVRFMARELETALGGVYSILAQDLQLPLATRLLDRMTKQKRLPKLPKGAVRPAIVTGLQALGRGEDLGKYNTLFQTVSGLGPEGLRRLNVGNAITRVGTALAIDMDGLIKSEDEIAQEDAKAAQQQQQALAQETMSKMATNATPHVVKAVAEGMTSKNG